MTARDYERWLSEEVSEWPGATVDFESGGKHNRAVVAFGDASRFVVYAASPSDGARGIYNAVGNLRRELAGLGAVRNERQKSTRPLSERNPGAALRALPVGEHASVRPDPWEALQELANRPIITAAGAYPDIAAEDYHGNANLLPAPSLSSSGAKTLLTQSPLHFWFGSPMNPDRPAEDGAPHFAIGRAAHDMILLTDRWPEFYNVLPEGFHSGHTKKWAEAIAEQEAAAEAGKTVLRYEDGETVTSVATALRQNKTAVAALTNGVAEETLTWQDPETGVWLRARPDFRPHSITTDADVAIVADLKFMAPTNASPDGFQRAIANNGYHQSAAFYSDGLKAVYGRYPSHWLHVVVEKDAPHCVALYPLPQEDIERGRWLNRKAIRRFAECLSRGTDRASWPGYADSPVEVGLPGWQRHRIDEAGEPGGGAWSEAA